MRPSRTAVLFAWGWVALGLAASVIPELVPVWGLAGGALAAALALDLALGRGAVVEVERTVAPALALGVSSQIRLLVKNTGVRLQIGDVFDHHPPQMHVQHLPQRVRVAPGTATQLTYEVVPTQRGDMGFGRVECLLDTPLRLWRRRVWAGEARPIKVYPNFRAVARYALLAMEDKVQLLGIRRKRRRGEGTDFHQLREYRIGDSPRQIDWRATSRHRKLISREHQDERDQQIVFMLDCGRRMHTRDGDYTHLDKALDSLLLLTHVALKQGDAVGLMTFGGRHRWLAPRKGTGFINTVLNSVYDLQTTSEAADLHGAAEQAMRHLPKRSLIVLITNMRDEFDESLLGVIELLGRKHLILLASLRDAVLNEVLAAPPETGEAALRVAAAHHYLAARDEAHARMREAGVRCLDVEPARLPTALVNGYLAIKAEQAL